MVIAQGEVWWADVAEPAGFGPGHRLPVVVIQCEPLNRSRIATVVVVPLTRDLKWSDAPGNVLLPARATGLPDDAVARVASIVALDKSLLTERVGKLPNSKLQLILSGVDSVLGR